MNLIKSPTNQLHAMLLSSFEDRARKEWTKTPYKKELLLTLTITDKCMLTCAHCFEESTPEKNTFLETGRVKDLAKEARNIFKGYNKRYIRITGGDPLLHDGVSEIIESFSRKRNSLKYSVLDVETNGWWAVNDKKTEEIVLRLKNSGATLLSASTDYYHKKSSEGKFDLSEHVDRIRKISAKQNLEFRGIKYLPLFSDDPEIRKLEEMCGDIPEVTPIGRARLLNEKWWGKYHLVCTSHGCSLNPPAFAESNFHTYGINISANGNVYSCISGKEFEHATLSIGNIYNKRLDEILKEQNNPIVNLIREKGLRKLAKLAGMDYMEHWKMYFKMTPCGECHEILREHGKEIAEKLYK